MGFHCNTNGEATRWIGSSSIQENQCFESWNSEKEEYQRHRTLQRGCFQHSAFESNDSLSKSAQYLRSSRLLVWRVCFEAWWNFRKAHEDRKFANTEWRETARSKFFGANSKERWARICKWIARVHSDLWDTGERNLIHKNLWECDIIPQSFCWNVIQNCCWCRLMVIEIELRHAEFSRPVADSNSRICAAIPERTVVGPVLQVHIIKFFGTYEIESQVPSTTTKERNSWEEPLRGWVTSARFRTHSHE